MLFGHNGIIRRVVRQYFKLGISQSAAELSYFLLFSFCPILMFLTAALARINLSEETIYTFTQLLPKSIQTMIKGYIDYISNEPSIRPMLVGTLLTLYFLSRAVRSMMYTIHQIYDIEDHKTIFYRWIMSFVFTCGFLLAIIGTLLLVIFGRMALNFIRTWLPVSYNITDYLASMSMPVAVCIIFIFVLLVNKLMPAIKLKFSQILPGALFSFVAWFIISGAFSFYVNNIARYSLLYGSLGAIIILMLWLYMTSITLLLGPLLNRILLKKDDTH